MILSVGSTSGDTSLLKAACSQILLHRLLTCGRQHNQELTCVLNRTHSLALLYMQKLFCNSCSEINSLLCCNYFLAAVHKSFTLNYSHLKIGTTVLHNSPSVEEYPHTQVFKRNEGHSRTTSTSRQFLDLTNLMGLLII